MISPDGEKAVFVRDYNLWLSDVASGNERALTSDGTKDYPYAGTILNKDPRLQVLWSPDSTRVYTLQLDIREVASRPLTYYVPMDGSLPSRLVEYKLAYPGDDHVESQRLIVIDTTTGCCQAADYPAVPYILHGPETFDGFFTAGMGWWSPDSRFAFFIDVARGGNKASVIKWDTWDGTTQVLLQETADTYIRLCEDTASSSMFLPLPDTDELLWFSERSGWGHLYLYDMSTGKLKRQVTGEASSRDSGEWLVRSVLHYDSKQRELLIQTAARDANISPYYRDICKVNIDSGEVTAVKTGDYDHMVYSPKNGLCIGVLAYCKIDNAEDLQGVSPCGQYIVTTYSRVDTAPVSLLIDRNGQTILTLETADISGLPDSWCWPEPVKLKAADNQTAIYGAVFRPPGFSEDKKYPVIDYLGSMRAFSLAPEGSFINSNYTNYYEMAR